MEKSLPLLIHPRAQSSRRTNQLQQSQSNAENLPHVFDRARPSPLAQRQRSRLSSTTSDHRADVVIVPFTIRDFGGSACIAHCYPAYCDNFRVASFGLQLSVGIEQKPATARPARGQHNHGRVEQFPHRPSIVSPHMSHCSRARIRKTRQFQVNPIPTFSMICCPVR